jgi:hypothetical protein
MLLHVDTNRLNFCNAFQDCSRMTSNSEGNPLDWKTRELLSMMMRARGNSPSNRNIKDVLCPSDRNK